MEAKTLTKGDVLRELTKATSNVSGRPRSKPDDGEGLGDDDTSKICSTRECSMPKRAVCDLDTAANWWLEEGDERC